MKYGELEFKDFSITTELQQGIVAYLPTAKIREYVSDSLQDEVEEIKNKCDINFKWYIEVEDRSTVCLEIRECDSVVIINDLLKVVSDKFNQSNLLIYLENQNEEELIRDCISDMDEDFNFDLLS